MARYSRRMLDIETPPATVDYRDLLVGIAPLRELIAECLASRRALVRRSVQVSLPGRLSHLGVTVSPLGEAGHRARFACFQT